MLRLPVYLDNNATTKMDPRVFDAMMPFFLEHYGNAASNTHLFGWEAKDAVDEAREQIGSLIHADPKEIIFTSGATESVNLALKGISEFYGNKGKHIITCVTEHKAVADTCHHLEKAGVEITRLPVGGDGLIDPEIIRQAINKDTIMIAVMYANNETGVLQPVEEIAAIAKQNNILFFCDATQAVGKIPVNVHQQGIDMMAFTAHKIYGPKGVGALFISRKNRSMDMVAQMDGGGHEKGFRSGTLNVPGIVGFGYACMIGKQEMGADELRIKSLRDELEKKLLCIEGAHLNGHHDKRMYNVSNISFRHTEGKGLMMALSKYMAISSGSACTSVVQEPSFVLKAMGVADEMALSAFRFSLGKFTTPEEIEFVSGRVAEIVPRFRTGQSVKNIS
jgi:cysteine desulfurase